MASNNLDDIIKENTPRLQSFVKSRVDNRDDADDIVQDTLYQFVRAASIMDNPVGRVGAWLYTVAHNLITNHGKKKREETLPTHRYSTSDDEAFMSDISEILVASDADRPDIRMLRNMVWEELDRALSTLPPEQRAALEMTEIQGLSTKQAAKRMGVSVSTFLSRKHYAVTHVRKRLLILYKELVND